MEYLRYGESSVRVVFGNSIDPEINKKVIGFYRYVKSKNFDFITNLIPSFSTCLIEFDIRKIDFERFTLFLKDMERETYEYEEIEPRIHEIPVKYGGANGPDMDFVCAYSGLSEEEVVKIHTSVIYTVYTIGFIPGFPYLGVLDRRLFVPRLPTPRTSVPAGSVGLAQLQTGIYTFESPGGWQIIGRTDLNLFDYRKPPYSMLQVGDRVRFVPV